MPSKPKILCLSDVTVGYSGPHIQYFMEFLCDTYGGEGIIVEPDDAMKPPKHHLFPNFTVKRIPTPTYVYKPEGRKEYVEAASKMVDKLRPDVIVVWSTFCLPVLFKINYRPKFVIYYYYESALVYGPDDVQMNAKIGKLVDLIIFTEENRAISFGNTCDFQDIPFCVVYNCSPKSSVGSTIPQEKRNGKIIYQGTLNQETSVDYYLDKKIQSLPIDLYGNFKFEQKEHYEKEFGKLTGSVHYKGLVSIDELSELRRHYLYSITHWQPVHENNLYASPNKFFESIASGVPPISTPHPQCKIMCNRYDCGLIIPDWTLDEFYETLRLGMYLTTTKRYGKMIENCIRAFDNELNWESQVAKVKKFLIDL